MEEWVEQLKVAAAAGARPLEGTITLEGFPGEATITTDRWGVPHVEASDRDALYAAQGYLHASERLWQIEFTRRIAQGRLSELVGEPGLAIDRFFRTVGLGRLARAWTEHGLDERTNAISGPYHAGFVAGAKSLPAPIEYQIIGAEPAVPETVNGTIENTLSISLLVSFGLSMNWSLELLRHQLAKIVGPDRAMQLTPFLGASPPASIPPRKQGRGVLAELIATAQQAGVAVPGTGSNNWVLSGDRTETGAPLLCNDPHLLVQMPAIWMEMHLRCPDMNVTGVSFPGIPGVLIGHNERIAWGFTNTQADVADLYLERLDEDGTHAEYDGNMEPVTIIEEPIRVRHEQEPRSHQVRVTRHGPVLTDLMVGGAEVRIVAGGVGDPMALRWVHTNTPMDLVAVEMLNEADDFASFRAAARRWPGVGQNMVYADVDGHIGYQFTGTYPIRRKGSGMAPAPGWDPAFDWEGTIPFDELPWSFDPVSGVLATANNRVVDADYPYHLTEDWEPSHRIRRIHSVLAAKQRHSVDDMAALQSDTHSDLADRLVPFAAGVDGAAGDLLRSWDRRLDVDSSGAALFAAWVETLAEALFKEELGDQMFETYARTKGWVSAFANEVIIASLPRVDPSVIEGALNLAFARCAERLGPDAAAWRWGAMHRIVFAHPLAGAMPPLAALLNAGPFEVGGGEDTVNRGTYTAGEDYRAAGIASYRQIIDLGDLDNSRSVITTGCSGNPGSPYYTDQTELWLRGEYHPMLFTPDAIAREAVGVVTLKSV